MMRWMFFFVLSTLSMAQVRVAVLPIKNLVGDMEYLTYSYSIADSVRERLSKHPQHGHSFVIVPADTIEQMLAQFSLDPSSPQYESDLWRAIETLHCTYAITGSFETTGGRMVLNLYVYDVATKLADQANAAKNLFKAPEKIYEVLPIAVKKLANALR